MIETILDHAVHPRYLNAQSQVLDLGANYGLFAKATTARFGCRCLAVEPSPEPFAAVSETPLISKVQAAAAAKSGMAPFHIAPDSIFSSLYGTSEVVRVIEVRAFSLPELFELVEQRPLDLLKMDIEGAEIELLNTCPPAILQQIRQISVEFHDHCDLTPTGEVKSTLTRLHRLGFFSVRMSRHGHHDTWLINRNLCHITVAELKFIEYLAPTWMGVKRVALGGSSVLQRRSASVDLEIACRAGENSAVRDFGHDITSARLPSATSRLCSRRRSREIAHGHLRSEARDSPLGCYPPAP